MPSDKYTKDFSDFGAYTFQGQITPNMFDHTGAGGDGQPGLQEMTQASLWAKTYHRRLGSSMGWRK